MVFQFEKPQPIESGREGMYDPGDSLPASSTSVESAYPVFGLVEDLLLGILRPVFEPMGIGVFTEHSEGTQLPVILARASRSSGANGFYPDDNRFLRSNKVAISVIMDDPEADVRCGQLIEAIQHVLMRAMMEQTVIPGVGHIASIRSWIDPVRVSDFQTSTNIVQYASLPKDAVRYEQNFNILVRPARDVHNPYVRSISS